MLPVMQTGQITRGLKPSWEPLIGLVGPDLVPGFMWMFALRLDDGTELHAYKSIATRQYVHLADDGRAFASHRGERYEEITVRQAVEQAFNGWEEAFPQPRNPEAVRALLERHAPPSAVASQELR
jgi:hypothetical protein